METFLYRDVPHFQTRGKIKKYGYVSIERRFHIFKKKKKKKKKGKIKTRNVETSLYTDHFHPDCARIDPKYVEGPYNTTTTSLYIETFPHFQKMTKVGVSIIVSIPHCPTDKAMAIRRDVSTFSKHFFHTKMANIGVSIIVSIPHCPTDKAMAIRRDIATFSKIPFIQKWPTLEHLSSLVFHTVIMTKCGLLKWSISEYPSLLVFHTSLLTILFRRVG